MNKNILIGVAAFGGLLLIAVLLPKTSNNNGVLDPSLAETIQSDEAISLFPTYPDTTVSNYRKSNSDDSRIFYSFTLTSEDSVKEINEWYRNALASDGWSIKSDKNVAGYQIIQGDKGNLHTSMQASVGESGTITISQQGQVRPANYGE